MLLLFCLTLYTEVSQTFVVIKCKTICRYYVHSKGFILVIGFKKIPIVKVAAKYAEIGRAGKLEAGFQ